MNWKSLRNNPPTDDCQIVVGFYFKQINKVRLFHPYLFFVDDGQFMDIIRQEIKTFEDFSSEHYYYINLDEVKLG